jgi:hypothetical protein
MNVERNYTRLNINNNIKNNNYYYNNNKRHISELYSEHNR